MRRVNRRLIAGLLLAVVCFLLLQPVLFAAEHALHDCAGENCEVCLQVAAGLQQLRATRGCLFAAAAVQIFLAVVIVCRRVRGAVFVTPCMRGVKLLN